MTDLNVTLNKLSATRGRTWKTNSARVEKKRLRLLSSYKRGSRSVASDKQAHVAHSQSRRHKRTVSWIRTTTVRTAAHSVKCATWRTDRVVKVLMLMLLNVIILLCAWSWSLAVTLRRTCIDTTPSFRCSISIMSSACWSYCPRFMSL